MQIIYNGTDITSRVQIAEAKYRDVSGGRSDSLDMVFNNGLAWHVWNPQKNDEIELLEDGLRTGKMYIQAVMPEDDTFRIIATAARAGAGRKKTQSYEGFTLGQLMANCAAENGMGYRVYGKSENTVFDYLIQTDESNPKFLNRVAKWEGAVLKTYNGRYTMIDITAAQEREPAETMQLSTEQKFAYRKNTQKMQTIRVITPYGEATAQDNAVTDGEEITVSDLPAKDAGTAARWARGILLSMNRTAEDLTIETDFHPNWTAMQRVDVIGQTEASGEWVVDEVTHDLIARKSSATFYRVIRTVE